MTNPTQAAALALDWLGGGPTGPSIGSDAAVTLQVTAAPQRFRAMEKALDGAPPYIRGWTLDDLCIAVARAAEVAVN